MQFDDGIHWAAWMQFDYSIHLQSGCAPMSRVAETAKNFMGGFFDIVVRRSFATVRISNVARRSEYIDQKSLPMRKRKKERKHFLVKWYL